MASGGISGFYTLSGTVASPADVQAVVQQMPAIIHANLGLPADYPESLIKVFVQSGTARRRLLAGQLTIGFVLLPAPSLPPATQLLARISNPDTTAGVAGALAVVAPALRTLTITRSDSTGTPQEPPATVQREFCIKRS